MMHTTQEYHISCSQHEMMAQADPHLDSTLLCALTNQVPVDHLQPKDALLITSE
jgi:hypothetical protein